MSIIRGSRRMAWGVPAVAAIGVVATVAVSGLGANASSPSLPAVTAEQLIAKVASAKPVALSGKATFSTSLGLPDLSALGGVIGPQAAGLENLLTGTSTLSVWESPKVGARADILGQTSEYSVTANAVSKDVWAYSSANQSATHITAPAKEPAAAAKHSTNIPSPDQLGTDIVARLAIDSTISVSNAVTVAGRNAYDLVLTPKQKGTLVQSVSVAVDAATWVPLEVQVRSTVQSAPAIDAKFTQIDYSTPADSLFAFTPPAGTKVKTVDASKLLSGSKPHGTDTPTMNTVVDNGWASIVEIDGLTLPSARSSSTPAPRSGNQSDVPTTMSAMKKKHKSASSASALGTQLLSAISQKTANGTLYSTSLVNIFVTQDGRAFIGSVPGSALEAAAAK